MQLSPHFSLEEFIVSETAARLGIDNYPKAVQYENLKMLAAAAESIRVRLGFPMHLNSGFRCPELNARVGGQPGSDHIDGRAMDFTCAAFGSPLEVCKAIAESGIPFEQIIHEYSSWCHFAIPQRGLLGRNQLLTIDKAGTRQGLES